MSESGRSQDNGPDNLGELPEGYRFDVARAVKGLTTLATREPDAPIVLTLGQMGAAGLETESDIRLRAEDAAALLADIGPDQRVQLGAYNLVLLRIAREEERPPTATAE